MTPREPTDARDRPAAAEDAATHRIRVGALGLAGVFLLVMLATALLRATGDSALTNDATVQHGNAAEPAEPLAQLGVAPGNAPDSIAATPARPAPQAAPRH